VSSFLIPTSLQKFTNSFEVYSPPLSDLSILIFLSERFSIKALNSYVALALGTAGRRGRGDEFPVRLERTPKFFRGRQVGDDNNIYYFNNIYIYIYIKINNNYKY
jgi:hypothetical protein